jgi:L-iditol 2-dehydrogenase
VAHRRQLALALGADDAIDPHAADPVAEVLAATHKRGVDLAIDCAAREDSINQALRMTRTAGRVQVTAVPSDILVPIAFHVIRRKELNFYTSRRANKTGHTAVEMLSKYARHFTPMVTHRMSLNEVQQAFEMLEAYSGGVGKIVVSPEH